MSLLLRLLHSSTRRRRMRLLLLVLAALPAASALASPGTLKVMTFNVRTPADTNDNRWENRRDVMAALLRAQAPDVIGTQELVKQQAEDLVARLPQYAWFGRGRRGDEGDEHMGVFYRTDRLRVLASGDFWLSDTPQVPGSLSWGHPYPRMVTWARFERISDGATFTFYDTHLPYREQDEQARLKGARLIASRLAKLPASEPVVLTGDFNTTPDSPTHALLTGTLQDAWLTTAHPAGPADTFHDFTGKADRRIDWILFRGMTPRAVASLTFHEGERYPSDHFPVVAEFDLPAPAAHAR